MDLETMVAGWPAEAMGVAVLNDAGTVASMGDPTRSFELASVTKLFTAWAVLVAAEEEILVLDQEVTAGEATVRDLLGHAGGLGPDGDQLAPPRSRRIYSNNGYEVLGELVARSADMPFERYVTEAVFEPLEMNASTIGSPAHGAVSTLEDVTSFAAELLSPRLLASETARVATQPHLPELDGVLPGFGGQKPNPWGLGPEIRGHKSPHWTGTNNSPETYGHFGQRGSFVWVDPAIGHACVVLTDEPFGDWAVEQWPMFNDGVVAAT